MARYIDADTLYVKVKAECNPYGKPTISFDDGCKVLDMIRRTSTADVAPVVHAHWIETYDYTGTYYITCSNPKCKLVWWLDEGTAEENEMYYCPKCGAKMDEVVE